MLPLRTGSMAFSVWLPFAKPVLNIIPFAIGGSGSFSIKSPSWKKTKNHETLKNLLLVTSLAALAACASSKQRSMDSVSCSSSASYSKTYGIPANILTAAKAGMPGFDMSSYDSDTDNGRKVYELDGTANGRKCEIKVDASGKVLRIDRD